MNDTKEKAENLFAGVKYELENGTQVEYLGFSPKYGHYVKHIDSTIESLPHRTEFFFVKEQ